VWRNAGGRARTGPIPLEIPRKATPSRLQSLPETPGVVVLFCRAEKVLARYQQNQALSTTVLSVFNGLTPIWPRPTHKKAVHAPAADTAKATKRIFKWLTQQRISSPSRGYTEFTLTSTQRAPLRCAPARPAQAVPVLGHFAAIKGLHGRQHCMTPKRRRSMHTLLLSRTRSRGAGCSATCCIIVEPSWGLFALVSR
jgi:hypothetical protein